MVPVENSAIQTDHLPEEIQASKKEVRMMVVALDSSLQDVECETIRRTLAEVTNHRDKQSSC